jgi:hypothetical protein
MKDITVIDLILEDINKYLNQEGINPLKVDLIQQNGVPSFCLGEIPSEEIEKINEYLKTYKSKLKILELIRDFRFGNKNNMSRELNKNHIWERYINYVKNEDELMKYLGAETIIKLK